MLLNVNINYLVNLKNSIGGGEPDILKFSRYSEIAGADGIVAHIADGNSGLTNYDVKNVRQHIKTNFILKMPITEQAKQLALDCKPDMICIVPQTDEASPSYGFNILKNQNETKKFITDLQDKGISTSAFIEPELDQVNSAYKANMEQVEINTKKFVEAFKFGEYDKEYNAIKEAVVLAHTLGLKVSLCKGINYKNVSILKEIPCVSTITIGHSITVKALYNGLDSTIKEMKAIINEK